ncbi:FG-GAP-like repeat-containing protein [uncultured Microscilla sp.]|uniref:FG-GAP-like repeat-containing protein n=1 Tax=uncultured Microscilla sp. TaxID=432653 RepID=UPI0026395BD8|nr:FG-GAP-like repeat-containing protein [uncultured Microscilla sp.]
MMNKLRTIFLFSCMLLVGLFYSLHSSAQYVFVHAMEHNNVLGWGDYDGDGDLDYVGSDTPRLLIQRNNTNNGTFTSIPLQVPDSISFLSTQFYSFDANSDGVLDIWADVGGYGLLYAYNPSNDSFELKNVMPNQFIPCVCTPHYDVGDYDNDGDLDVLYKSSKNSSVGVVLLENKGNFVFAPKTILDNQKDYVYPGGFPGTPNIKWYDYNQDGYLDILSTINVGSPSAPEAVTTILQGDGQGNFTETGLVFQVGTPAYLHTSDYNGDGYLDVLVAGHIEAKIWLNRGNGNFEQGYAIASGTFNAIYSSGDYDNDGDIDLLGRHTIFRNDNNQGFTRVDLNVVDPNDNVNIYQQKWLDYDGDGRLDIFNYDGRLYRSLVQNVNQHPPLVPTNLSTVVEGDQVTLSWDRSEDPETKQNGLTYNIYIGTSLFEQNLLTAESIIDPALPTYGRRLVTRAGNMGSRNHFTFRVLNVGTTYYWSVQAIDPNGKASFFASPDSFEWVDLPTPPTHLMAKVDSSNTGQISLSWSPVSPTNCKGFVVFRSLSANAGFEIVDTVHFDFPHRIDSHYSEDNAAIVPGTIYYYKLQAFNDRGNSAFTPTIAVKSHKSPAFSWAKTMSPTIRSNGDAMSWGDYNNDGYLDMLTMGHGQYKNDMFFPIVKTLIYKNQNGQSLSEINLNNVPALLEGAVAWGDFNNDGFLDLALAGGFASSSGSFGAYTGVFANKGNGSFEQVTISSLKNRSHSAAAWGDYDNDGDLDLVVTGIDNGTTAIDFYRNDGGGNFVYEGNKGVAGVSKGSIDWGDYDNDGDLDLLVAGLRQGASDPLVHIYTNQGQGSFSEHNFSSSGSQVSWGDYDNDGFLDILASGDAVKIFQNQPVSNSSLRTFGAVSATFRPGKAVWIDHDNDGDLDVIVYGDYMEYSDEYREDNSQTGTTKAYRYKGNIRLYENNGGQFSRLANLGEFTFLKWDDFIYGGNTQYHLSEFKSPSETLVVGDYDGDGDLDFMVAGYEGLPSYGYKDYKTHIHRNEALVSNVLPAPPAGLKAEVQQDSVTLHWNVASDATTPSIALTYNLRIGTSPGKDDVLPAMADLQTGKRRVVQRGFQGVQKTIRNLPPGVYYWSVQALDHSLAGSLFAQEQVFYIKESPLISTSFSAQPISSTTVLLTWSDESNVLTSSDYIVEMSIGNNLSFYPVDTVASSIENYTKNGLTENTTYFFRIRAVNTTGMALSGEASATTNNLPTSPDSLKATAVSATQVQLHWKDVSSNETGFAIERKSVLSGDNFEAEDVLNNSGIETYNDLQVIGNVTYTYRVFAYNVNGQSLLPQEVSVTTPIDPSVAPPGKPLKFSASPLSINRILLDWSYDNGLVNYFSIERSEGNLFNFQPIAVLDAAIENYQDITVVEGVVYYYRIRAANAGGFSDYSGISSARAECNLPIFIALDEGHPQRVCDDQDARLLVATEGLDSPTYQWQRNGIAVSDATLPSHLADKEGTYTCLVTAYGCTQQTNEIIVIKQEPLDSVNIAIQNDTLVASVTNATRYVWHHNNQEIPGNERLSYLLPVSSGSYHVVIERDGCTATSRQIELNNINGLRNRGISNDMKVSYASSLDVVSLAVDTHLQGEYVVYLRNSLGHVVATKKGVKRQKTLQESIPLGGHAAGIYILEVNIGKYRGVKKVGCLK